jgi:tetratricopeptide (TPR) repeat protein
LFGSLIGTFAQPGTSDQLIKFYQSRVARDPEDPLTYSKLGAAYIQKARETGDVAFYELGENALKKSLDLIPHPSIATNATVQLAAVYLAKHQFKAALTYAQKAAGLGTGDRYPYALIGDAYIELGQYEKAGEAYAEMLGHSGPLYPHSRLSYLHFLKGDIGASLEHMRSAVKTAIESNSPVENIAWSRAQLGDLFFHMGDLPAAEKSYRDALAAYPRYHRGLAGLARVHAAQKKYREAIASYQQALSVIPLPEHVAALGDVYTKIGRAQDAKKQYDLVEYIGHLNTLNKAIYNRELALFYADHDMKLKIALELAQKELEIRSDIYTYDVLAWTLYKNGRYQQASTAISEALKIGTKDARLLFHAGMIHHGLGNADAARDYLARVLSTNPHFHLLQADVAARTLKQLETARP